MRCKVKVSADAIRRKLAERNQTLKWLILKLDISSGYMSQLVHGIRNPSPKLRQRMMRVLEVKNFNELFSIAK